MKRFFPLFFLMLFLLVSFPSKGTSALSEGKLLAETLSYVDRHYVDTYRIKPESMLRGALDRIVVSVPEILVTYPTESLVLTVGTATKRFSLKGLTTLEELRKTLQALFQFIDHHYSGNITKDEIEYAAIDGALASLDPHSTFLPPKVFNEFKVGTRGQFGGIGIVIGLREGQLTVIAPLDDTPASKAGVKSGDRILEIDHASTINMSLTEAVELLRGEVGSSVSITLQREGKNPFKSMLTRSLIDIDSVQSTKLAQNGKTIGYIRVKNFQSNTDRDVISALKELKKEGKMDGLILDLRNNPGGLLDQSIALADHFLKDGTIVSTLAAHGKMTDSAQATKNQEPPYPIVALVNEGSASASEIVAGALQKNNRALVLGRRTFGKGSVQTIFELSNNAALKLTVAQYLAGGTEKIQLIGVVPDIEFIAKTIDKENMDLIQDEVKTEFDLESHLEQEPTAKRNAAIQLTFFKPKENEEDELLRTKREYAKKAQIEDDFAIEVAQKILTQTETVDRPQMLHKAKPIVAKIQEEQNNMITKAFSPYGVDWTVATKTGKPTIRLQYFLKKEGKKVESLLAGDKAEIELSVTNNGTTPLSKLIAIGNSEQDFLANKEFPLGKLLPQEMRSWSVPIQVPPGLPTQQALLNVEFSEHYGNKPESFDIIVPVKERDSPQFGIRYAFQNVKPGNALPKNRPLELMLEVTNIGNGSTGEETIAILSNKSGEKFFLKKGREKLGVMKAKASKKVVFEFLLDPTFEKKNAEMELTVFDPQQAASISKKITLALSDASFDPPAQVQYRAPMISVSKQIENTTEETFMLKGKLTDDHHVQDCYIFLENKKISYIPNTKQTADLNFFISIPLEVGMNHIIIAARDEQDLTERRVLVIRRTKTPLKKPQQNQTGSLL